MPSALLRTAAVAGALLCLSLTPVQSLAWNKEGAPPLIQALQPYTDWANSLRLDAAPDSDPYYFFGRMFFAVYLLGLAGLVLIHRSGGGDASRRRRWYRVLIASLLLGFVGDLGPYWGGLDSPFNAMFVLEELAMLGLMVGAVGYGVSWLRSRAAPRWIGWVFIASAPLAPVGALVTGYFPHGIVLPFSLTVAVAAVAVRRPGRTAIPA